MSSSELLRKASSLFVVGFPGPQPDRDVESLIDQGVAGVILFRRNIESAEQVLALNTALKQRAGRPLLSCVDQEGGRVARLRNPPFTAVPSMRELAAGGEAAAAAAGTLLAREVRAVGFDWDFAPVMDVDTNPANPVIGDRSLSRDPELVCKLGVALGVAMEAEGVASCAKHFPGHGDTHLDSHLHLPSLPHGLERLQQVELKPFQAYARANLASVMTAHVIFQALDPGVPATMSHKVLTGLLRQQLGFGGLIVSDDMEMKAVADHYEIGHAVVESLNAGCDLFLVCHQAAVQRAGIEAIVRAVESGKVARERLDAACAQVSTLAMRFAQVPDPSWLDALSHSSHQQLAARMRPTLPLGLDPTERLA
jgi:beta-N-acetylhexosaminidase